MSIHVGSSQRLHGSMEAQAPRSCADVAVRFAAAQRREPAVERTLLISLWRCTAEIAACSRCRRRRRDGERRTTPIERADRHWSGHDRGNVAAQHRQRARLQWDGNSLSSRSEG